jgi:hypothetical protein
MKTTLIILFAIIIVLIATTVLFAQPGLPENPSQAPIDGGLGLLALGGGAYAWKKIKEKSRE